MLKGTRLGLWGCFGWEMRSSLPFFKIGGFALFTLAFISLIVMCIRKRNILINLFTGIYAFGFFCISIPLILFGFGKFCTIAAVFYIFDLYFLPLFSFIFLMYAYRKLKQEREVNLDRKTRQGIDKILGMRDQRYSILILWIILMYYTIFWK
jgi:hypothetical protein